MKETGSKAAKRENGGCSLTEDGENGRRFGTDIEEVSKCCLVFPAITLTLVNRERSKEVKNITRLVSDAHLDAGELRRHAKKCGNCKKILNDTRDEKLAGKG